jgi:hypothetical protein
MTIRISSSETHSWLRIGEERCLYNQPWDSNDVRINTCFQITIIVLKFCFQSFFWSMQTTKSKWWCVWSYSRFLYSLTVGFTKYMRYVQRLPDLSWPGCFDFNGKHIKQSTIPPQKWHWSIRLKGCLRVLNIDILTLTQYVVSYTQYCMENSHAP